ncbi:MAG: hypothetical protein M3Q30_26510 [Actinomycetota bacterium]|nr:hypothetical protein [Actinomycetota bacterium]
MTERSEQFPPLTPEREAIWSQFGKWDTVWFPQFLGIEVEELRQDYARMRLPYRPEFRQPDGSGILAATATLTYKVSSKPLTL